MKRSDACARTVAGGNPTLRSDEIEIPEMVAYNMTMRERVTTFNKKRIEELIRTGRALKLIKEIDGKEHKKIIPYALGKMKNKVEPGDKVLREGRLIDPKSYLFFSLEEGDKIVKFDKTIPVVVPPLNELKIENGDIVERYLQNGDLCILNRQPTQKNSVGSEQRESPPDWGRKHLLLASHLGGKIYTL